MQCARRSSRTNLAPQLEEFAADAFGAPGHVFHPHLANEGNGFGCDPGLRCLGLRLAAPDQAEQLAMPAEEGVGLDDKEGLSPEGRRSCQQKKPEAVSIAQLRAFNLAMQDDKLVPEQSVRGNELGLAAHGILNHAYEERARAGFEAVLDAVADLVGNAENLGSEAMENVEHAWMAPGI